MRKINNDIFLHDFKTRTLPNLFYDYENSGSNCAPFDERLRQAKKITGIFQGSGSESLSPYQAMGNNRVMNIHHGETLMAYFLMVCQMEE